MSITWWLPFIVAVTVAIVMSTLVYQWDKVNYHKDSPSDSPPDAVVCLIFGCVIFVVLAVIFALIGNAHLGSYHWETQSSTQLSTQVPEGVYVKSAEDTNGYRYWLYDPMSPQSGLFLIHDDEAVFADLSSSEVARLENDRLEPSGLWKWVSWGGHSRQYEFHVPEDSAQS